MKDGALNVVVMLGGPSAEREVSLRSGAAVSRALAARGHRVTELDPQGDRWELPGQTDVVFLALHGTYGEDGTVQSQLEELRMPYTGCDAESSRVAFDKVAAKGRFMGSGVPTPAFRVVTVPEAGWPTGMRGPLVVKPVCQGSSVGLAFAAGPGEWAAALGKALAQDARALVEEQVVGRELTVGVLEQEALPVVEVCPREGTYDYRNKYTPGATEYVCPAVLEEEVRQRVVAAALGAFRAVGGRDYARVDVMLDALGRPWVLEVNTLPGMTETSLLPKAAAAAGVDFGMLCERMIRLALRRSGKKEVAHVG